MPAFEYFVVFAEMRTGSNFLETNLNTFDGIRCLGEAFNPHFVGYPDAENVLGITEKQRDADPHALLDAVQNSDGLNGFRYFNDHDPRVLSRILNDPTCAKIILTRNPVESYVSWKIAQQTGQWKLTNVKHAKTEKITFDAPEFVDHLQHLQDFQIKLMASLQRTGQTAFYIDYEDLRDVDVMNGLARFLGSGSQIEQLDDKLKKQNPAPLSSKVSNFEDMEASLARLDLFNLSRTPNFEPRRGPMVPRYVAAAESPLLFMPIKSGPSDAVMQAMAQLDGVTQAGLQTGLNQKQMRLWMRAQPGFRSFTVLRHPLARAHAAFCELFLNPQAGGFADIRKALKTQQGIKLPNRQLIPETDEDYTLTAHQDAFAGFLRFLKSNLNAQTAQRIDPAWASQISLIQGMCEFGPPDAILREESLTAEFADLVRQAGLSKTPKIAPVTDPYRERLAKIYSGDLERLARDAYPRDYLVFGFGDWTA